MKGTPPSLSIKISHNKDGFHMMHRGITTQPMCKASIDVRRESQISQSGFTLVEVMIVIAIIGILASIISLNFRQMNNKNTIESYTKEIHALLMRARNDASTSNIQRIVTLAANQIQVTIDDNGNGIVEATDGNGVVNPGEPTITYPYPQFALQFAPALNPIIFDRRGIANAVGNQTLFIVHPRDSAPGTDCIVVFATRISIGRWSDEISNGGNNDGIRDNNECDRQ